jgi:hypothetical protein
MENFVESSRKSITDVELKQLLVALRDSHNIGVRYRVMGEMWGNYFLLVTSVDDRNAILYDELNNKYHTVDVKIIVQFELDSRYRNFQPNFHYDVTHTFELGV